jgi:hypothetical protein
MKTDPSKRRALLTLLAAVPVLAYQTPGEESKGLEFKPRGFRIEATGTSAVSLLDLSMTFPEAGSGEFLFLRIRINGKEELRLSIKDAMDILRGPA